MHNVCARTLIAQQSSRKSSFRVKGNVTVNVTLTFSKQVVTNFVRMANDNDNNERNTFSA